MPYFSIIIPVYNVAPYLRECLDSVLAQTFTDWEAICVDDGSTDDSGSILDEYAANDKRFKVFHQANAGVSAARNNALGEIKGEWVGFLDADDVWGKEWLNNIHENVDRDVDWIRTGWTDWDMEKGMYSPKLSSIIGTSEKIFSNDIFSFGWYLISRCGFPFINFYKKNLLDGVYFSEGIRFREDALFCFEVAMKSKKLKIVDESEYFRRERIGSATFSPRKRDDSFKLLTAYAEIWKKIAAFNKMSDVDLKRLVEASTFWVAKDVRQWYSGCLDKEHEDCVKVYKCVLDLLRRGAVGHILLWARLDGLRWRIFLKTGWFRVLLISLHNPLGMVQYN